MKTTLATIAITAAIISSPAMAQKCENIILDIANQAGQLMQVVQVSAYNSDDRRWYTINRRNHTLQPKKLYDIGARFTNLDIRRSEGENVAIRVKYKFVYGSNQRYYTDTVFKACESNRSMWRAIIPTSNHNLLR